MARAVPRGARVLPLLVFVAAAVIYAQNGHRGTLLRDDSIYVYAGQQLVEGVPPYRSTFEAKTPLAMGLCGVGVALARAVGADDVVVVRYVFLVVSALAAMTLFLLAAELFGARATGVLAALIFVGFFGFGLHALSGPRPKALMVLLETASLLFAARRSWLAAALCGSLASLVWQPAAVFAAVPVLLAGAQGGHATSRVRGVASALAAAALPWLVLLALLAASGALGAFLEDTFLFNLRFLERQQDAVGDRIAAAVGALDIGYHSMKVPLVAGLVAVAAMVPWRLRRAGGVGAFLRGDPFAALLLAYPVLVGWSLLDFQGYVDLFILLPYAALGAAGLVHGALEALGARGWMAPRVRASVVGVLCAGLVVSAGAEYRANRWIGLERQRQWASHLSELAGPGGDIVSLGVPQVLVLLGRRNPSPYVFLCCGMIGFIESREPGGFDGWLRALADSRPAAVVLEGSSGPVARRLAPLFADYRRVQVGDWWALVQRPGARSHSSR